MDTPFFDAIAAASRRRPRFFVPGHKGNGAALPVFRQLLRWDMTEVEGTYDLSDPTGPLAQSQRNMTRAYGSGATLYSAFGSTSCIQAMLALFVPAGGKVVMARGCHVSALRALSFLDATPVWVPLKNGLPQPKDIGAALRQSGAKAVYITSVDYYGNMPDIAAIAQECGLHGAALLCDNAHGAHLRFFEAREGTGAPGGLASHSSAHPLALGADACADSAHKTLPCLTPAALLHLKDPALERPARAWLNHFSSTSPSYPVMLSLDLAAGLLLNEPPDFAGAEARLRAIKEGCGPLVRPAADPLRLVLAPGQAQLSPKVFADALLERDIVPEYDDGTCLVFMASPFNTEEDFSLLEEGILYAFRVAMAAREDPDTGEEDAEEQDEGGAPPNSGPGAAEALPQVSCSIRQALFAPKERVSVHNAAGRVCASLFAPCPPGVPLIVPGEIYTRALAAQTAQGGILAVDVLK